MNIGNLIITIVLLIIGFVAVIAFLQAQFRRLQQDQDRKQAAMSDPMMMLKQDLQSLQQNQIEHSRQVQQTIQGQFGQSTKIIQDVTERLTKLDETNRQVVNFADQLQSLQDILKNPKQRGILGEYYLETVLKNVLPPGSYQMQYRFKDGEAVDAVVFAENKVIPIDSKFSLENYNRLAGERDESEKVRLEKLFVNDLKMRITETAKYIRPEEKTMEFAFMFIPHEAIYYDLLVNKIGAIQEDTENMIQRAARKYHVIIVSPTSFLAYLQTVMQGMRALQVEKSTKEILKNVENLGRHLKSYETYFVKMGNHLDTTVNSYNAATKEFLKVDKDVLKITKQGEAADLPLLDRTSIRPDDEE
ncbi:MAG: DNA recombination protein RmuC [Patescibacteria group bacterium]|jgi:DNA recombination protein RmuC